MAVRLVVEGDPVQGTDKHNVKGQAKNSSPPPPTVPYAGVGSFTYEGTMREGLSDLVRIDGAAVALTTSKSRLNVGEDVPLTGRHSGAKGSGFDPAEPAPIPDALLKITDPIGEGVPSADAGSGLVSVGNQRVLLDGDAIDTCDGTGATANSTVTSSTQDFVRASE